MKRIARIAMIAKESKLRRRRMQLANPGDVWQFRQFWQLSRDSKLLLRDTLGPTHIRPQSFRNNHAAVGLLVVFQDRQPGTADGQAAAVERVHELRLLAAF